MLIKKKNFFVQFLDLLVRYKSILISISIFLSLTKLSLHIYKLGVNEVCTATVSAIVGLSIYGLLLESLDTWEPRCINPKQNNHVSLDISTSSLSAMDNGGGNLPDGNASTENLNDDGSSTITSGSGTIPATSTERGAATTINEETLRRYMETAPGTPENKVRVSLIQKLLDISQNKGLPFKKREDALLQAVSITDLKNGQEIELMIGNTQDPNAVDLQSSPEVEKAIKSLEEKEREYNAREKKKK